MDNLQLSPIAYEDESRFNRQALFLYDLLKERDPSINISHRELPTFHRHVSFMLSRPYHCWHVVELIEPGPDPEGGFKTNPIGSVYLTRQDEIGLFLVKEYQGKGYGRRVLSMLFDMYPRQRYLAHIAPGNEHSKKFFQGQGFLHIQDTYALEAK